MGISNITVLRLLLLISLFTSQLVICLNAAPATRLGRLLHEPHALPIPHDTHMVTKEQSWDGHESDGRMALGINDYPGSGANNRHTPWRPPFGRCYDC